MDRDVGGAAAGDDVGGRSMEGVEEKPEDTIGWSEGETSTDWEVLLVINPEDPSCSERTLTLDSMNFRLESSLLLRYGDTVTSKTCS